MVDYTRATGGSGTMMIRDTGTYVEFWLRAGDETYNYQLDWSYVVNGQNGSREFRFVQGGNYQMLGSFLVTTDQVVVFGIGRSGTQGLGGPTTFSVNIARAIRPLPPIMQAGIARSATSIEWVFKDGPDRGSAIDLRNLHVSTIPDDPNAQPIAVSGSSYVQTGLVTGTTYYAWMYEHNALGWSDRSGIVNARTWGVPGQANKPDIYAVQQTTFRVRASVNEDGGYPITGYQLGYGLFPAAGGRFTLPSADAPSPSLQPGKIYYVMVRAQNQMGYGPWSEVVTVILVGGCFVWVNGVPKPAVPYVNVGGNGITGTGAVGGTWKVARPYVRKLGVWKISQ
jgi:hypothetical protein